MDDLMPSAPSVKGMINNVNVKNKCFCVELGHVP